KCGAVENAVKMFEKMGERDSVTWNSMISGYCQSGDYTDSFKIFRMMIKDYGLYLNRVACLSAVSACSSVYWLTHGREIHAFVLKRGWDAGEFFSALIDLYMKCGDLRNSNNVFRSILDCESVRGNPVIWNVMILGYVSNGCLTLALELFIEMLGLGIKPDSLTMVDVLVLCYELSDLEVGKQIHGFILIFGLENDVRVCTALMEMYFKCGDPESGFNIFKRSQNRNLVTWGAVLSNSAQNGYPIKALELFYDFMSEHGGFPDSFLLVSVLRACSSLTSKPKCEEIHGSAVKMSFDSRVNYIKTPEFYLLDMYGKGRDMESAQKVFSGLLSRDLVSWNALISGYSQNECADEALNSFREMQSEQIRPNTVTASCILSVCAHLSVFSVCKEVHCYLLQQGFLPNILVSNSLVVAYAKCGDMNSSWTIFEQMPERNEVSNSIIFGLGMHGCNDKIIVLFGKMKEAGMKPNHATFTALLSACSHAGRVDMGWQFFRSMSEDYKLEPQLEHYTCMVDLLGQAGHLNQAYDLIMAMPLVPDAGIWGSLIGSCRSHSNEKLAELIANHIFELDPTNIGYRVLLANMYEDFGKSNEVARIRGAIKDMGLKKQTGCSWIEINNNVSIFVASDCSHLKTNEIYAAINVLTMEMKRAG
ncbi:LOW QUALITY PROTEIN: PPR domain-containing protein/PPR_2 domain-containing protein, partial [Cephalotus follicularis]